MTDIFKKLKSAAKGTSLINVPRTQVLRTADGRMLEAPPLSFPSYSNPSVDTAIRNMAESRETYLGGIYLSSEGLLPANDLYCTHSNFYDLSEDYFKNRDYSKGNEIPDFKDTFRFVSRKYWSKIESPQFVKVGFSRTSEVPFDIEFGTEVYNQDNSSTVTLRLVQKAGSTNLDDRFMWRSYINGTEAFKVTITTAGEFNIPAFQSIIPKGEMIDEVFILDQVKTASEVEKSTPTYENTFGFECDYNYYIKQYEAVLADATIPENISPNIYALLVESNKRLSSDDPINKLTTLNGLSVKSVREWAQTRKSNLRAYSIFEEWAKNAPKVTFAEKTKLSNKFSNIVLSLNEIESKLQEEIQDQSALFPMMVRGDLDIRGTSEVSQVIKSTDLDKSILNKIVDSNIEFELSPKTIASSKLIGVHKTKFKYFKEESKTFSDVSVKNWDLEALISKVRKNNPEQEDYKVLLDAYEQTNKEISNSLYAGIYPAILDLKIKKIIKKYDRSFKEILSGKLCHTDVIAYKISKYEVNGFGKIDIENPIQNYYFNNSQELERFYLTDTQIKFGKSYKYIVSSYVIVFGNSYNYEIKDVTDTEASILVNKKPRTRLYEMVIHESRVIKIRDAAPVAPLISFLTYINDSHNMLISLERMMGTYKELPVQILRTDEKFIFRMSDSDGMVQYSGDDNIELFEVFKTDTEPKSYADFGGIYKRVRTSTANNDIMRTPEVSVREKIQENKKYYYFCRAIDSHQNISNPSRMFEVELVRNSGATYPIIKDFEFKKETKNKFKNVNKYIRIYPSIKQTNVNLERSQLKPNESPIGKLKQLRLGTDVDSIWDKKFKFRFTSKASGKKLDIDVSFKYTAVGYLFQMVSNGVAVTAGSFTEALQLLLLEQNVDLI
jgi:hypothetical protein